MKIYDWDTNKIEFQDTYGNAFSIQLRGRITIINGDSTSGKTYLCTKIRELQDDMNKVLKVYDTDDIVLIDRKNIHEMTNNRHKLIIIDKGDTLLGDTEADLINKDINNRYLIFIRKVIGLDISPNHFGELVKHDKTLTEEYRFNVKGWH